MDKQYTMEEYQKRIAAMKEAKAAEKKKQAEQAEMERQRDFPRPEEGPPEVNLLDD